MHSEQQRGNSLVLSWNLALVITHSHRTKSHRVCIGEKVISTARLSPFLPLWLFLSISRSVSTSLCLRVQVSLPVSLSSFSAPFHVWAFACLCPCLSLFASVFARLHLSLSSLSLPQSDYSASKCTQANKKDLGLIYITSQRTKDN